MTKSLTNSGSLVVTTNMTLFFHGENYTFTIRSSAELMGRMEVFETGVNKKPKNSKLSGMDFGEF